MKPAAGLVVAAALAVPSLAHAEAPFDLRSLRAEHPGAGSVILERTYTVSQPDDATLRLAVHSRRAVLDDVGSRSLSLFSEPERPGCRTPAGVRIEVHTADGETLLTTRNELARLPSGDFAVWKGPRRGVATGALIEESFHVDYSTRCFGGLVTIERVLGDKVPVLKEQLVVDCTDCAVDVTHVDLPVLEEGGARVVRWEDVAPLPDESYRPSALRPQVYVSTSEDPLAWARVITADLKRQRRKWSREANAWATWARGEGVGMKDKTAALAYGLSNASVEADDSVWEYGLSWGEPVGPNTRPLRPLEWLAMASQALASRGGIPVLYRDNRGEVPDGAASLFDWDQYGVWLPQHGLVTTEGWYPARDGASDQLAGHHAVLLNDEPTLHTFSSGPDDQAHHSEVILEPSGIASLLVRVHLDSVSGWSEQEAQLWERMLVDLKKDKDDPREAARTFASARFFERRPLAATTLTPKDDLGIEVRTAWTEKDVIKSGTGRKLVPVVTVGMPLRLASITPPRELPIQLPRSRRSGRVVVIPPDGYRAAALPESSRVDAGPVQWSATWSFEGDRPVLSWELLVTGNIVPADLVDDIGTVAADIERIRRTRLVFDAL